MASSRLGAVNIQDELGTFYCAGKQRRYRRLLGPYLETGANMKGLSLAKVGKIRELHVKMQLTETQRMCTNLLLYKNTLVEKVRKLTG